MPFDQIIPGFQGSFGTQNGNYRGGYYEVNYTAADQSLFTSAYGAIAINTFHLKSGGMRLDFGVDKVFPTYVRYFLWVWGNTEAQRIRGSILIISSSIFSKIFSYFLIF